MQEEGSGADLHGALRHGGKRVVAHLRGWGWWAARPEHTSCPNWSQEGLPVGRISPQYVFCNGNQ